MLNFRTIHKQAEEHITLAIGGLFLFLALLILFQTFFSPTIVIAFLILLAIVAVTIIRPLWILGFLSIYFPFESVILKFIPNDAYAIIRYASEGMIYVIAGVILLRVLVRAIKLPATPIDLPFVLFLVTLLGSILINFVPLGIAVLGARQILRFMIVFFLVVYLKPSKQYIKNLTMILFAIVLFECGLGIAQSIIGERLDLFLLPSDSRSLGEITLTAGVDEFWDPGSRIFATLGRYDRLGNFISFFLLIGTGFLFCFRRIEIERSGGSRASPTNVIDNERKKMRWWLFALFAIGIPSLLLTYSRSSWFAFLLGFLFIGLWIKRDRRVAIALASFIIVVIGYLAITGISVRYITEIPGQTITERFLESFSYARWRGEYYGLGRLYWDVQTPLRVIPSSPIFGVGPGQFGGGAAAALHNTKVYDALGLPFGVFGTQGAIDNNWFAIWGEAGTLGLIFYMWMFIVLFKHSVQTFRSSNDPFTRALAIGFAACVLGVSFNAITSTLFEIRTAAFYFWLYAGFVVALGEKKKYENHSSE